MYFSVKFTKLFDGQRNYILHDYEDIEFTWMYQEMYMKILHIK